MLKKLITRIAREQAFLKALHADILKMEDILVITPRFLHYIKMYNELIELSIVASELVLFLNHVTNALNKMACQKPTNELEGIFSSLSESAELLLKNIPEIILSTNHMNNTVQYNEENEEKNEDKENNILKQLLSCSKDIQNNLKINNVQQVIQLIDKLAILKDNYTKEIQIILSKNELVAQLPSCMNLMNKVNTSLFLTKLKIKKQQISYRLQLDLQYSSPPDKENQHQLELIDNLNKLEKELTPINNNISIVPQPITINPSLFFLANRQQLDLPSIPKEEISNLCNKI